MIVVQREHRSLHDLIARTCVVYDWGDRSAEMPGPLSQTFSTEPSRCPDRATHDPQRRRGQRGVARCCVVTEC